MNSPHISVLASSVIEVFSTCKLKIFVDATLGAGGHSHAILNAFPSIRTLVGFDQDPVALDIAKQRLEPWQDKIVLRYSNFSKLTCVLNELHIQKVEGILIDLGVSSMQLDMAEKGFSFSKEGPLDMRMDPSNPLTAAEVINTYSEKDLGRIFREYGEERQWRSAAHAIVTAREKKAICSTFDLANVLKPLFSWKKKGINPLTLIFQALRIHINSELEQLEKVIPQAIEMLENGGRLAIISFHSLEDRVVKNAFRQAASDKEDSSGFGDGTFIDKEPIVKLITRKPICPSQEEVGSNPRSRSAKMRVVEKL